jgi:hypothetical protein
MHARTHTHTEAHEYTHTYTHTHTHTQYFYSNDKDVVASMNKVKELYQSEAFKNMAKKSEL